MPKPEARLSITVNGHQLDGIKVKGKWQLTCSFPELAKYWSGDPNVIGAMVEFTKLALAGCVKVTVTRD